MASNETNLSHNEMWDDTVLVDSWNEALEEYKKYHSIHRHGGNVDDLRISKPEVDGSDAKPTEGEKDGSMSVPNGDTPDAEMKGDDSGRREYGNSSTQHSLPHGPSSAPVPAGLLGSMRDEGLKRLLMSWYYAGYYTGYYEGQRDQPQGEEESEQR
ncbi:hypothetical protein F4778DRAFT_777466 [Xylariomycetidae sp. FL2044]|nr:hypothetical protein F4778DRAFT_777466 [Xylariomycetidae sp. FL2044]